jgi:hypothetical protein
MTVWNSPITKKRYLARPLFYYFGLLIPERINISQLIYVLLSKASFGSQFDIPR